MRHDIIFDFLAGFRLLSLVCRCLGACDSHLLAWHEWYIGAVSVLGGSLAPGGCCSAGQCDSVLKNSVPPTRTNVHDLYLNFF